MLLPCQQRLTAMAYQLGMRKIWWKHFIRLNNSSMISELHFLRNSPNNETKQREISDIQVRHLDWRKYIREIQRAIKEARGHPLLLWKLSSILNTLIAAHLFLIMDLYTVVLFFIATTRNNKTNPHAALNILNDNQVCFLFPSTGPSVNYPFDTQLRQDAVLTREGTGEPEHTYSKYPSWAHQIIPRAPELLLKGTCQSSS